MRVPLRTEVVCLIAKKVVDILNEIGFDCALFGSLACYLYGNARSPNDIDLVAFPPSGRLMDAEWLKQEIAGRDLDHFSLEHPKDPTATYRVLYFVVDRGLAPNNTFHKNKCKIDVLVPGTMHLPSLCGPSIKWQGGLPVVPFPLLLLQKLQGWDDHMHMVEPYKFEKHVTDASDVQALLKLEHVVSLRFSQPWMDHMLFSREFMDLSVERVKDFCDMYPDSRSEWFRLGFGVYYY
ncbi:hypothetical protein BDZ97DRAFT_1729735 [Flammula alnicola]|nr:hypothetical protein BDZ97DRAFT_1729735 [Flammula alnicola]